MPTMLDRILAEADIPDLFELLAGRLNPTDLQSLMLAVYARRSASRTPAAVLADYERSRFFGAASFSRSEYAALEQVADQVLSSRFQVLTLSPLAPLASCAAVANVGQDWSVSTVRTGEVVSDPTNILALEAALRRKGNMANRELVHLGTTQRVVRPQVFGNPNMLAHFGLLSLLSSGRDRGSYGTEAEAISVHLDTQLGLFRQFLGGNMPFSVSYTIVSNSADDARLRALNTAARLHGASVWEESDREAVRGYYSGFCFHIWAEPAEGRQQLSDGGAVDWVARLIANGKERTLISGCGVEGLLALRRRLMPSGDAV